MTQTAAHGAINPDVVSILQRLIQFNTVNPPGNETEAAQWIVDLLRANGIEAEMLEGTPGRGNAVARIRSANPVARPLLLMGHLDVVSVEAEKWTRDPFGGEIEDGFIWGRGALDMKSQVAAGIATLLAVKQANLPLKRDLILMATSDEEVSNSFSGADWLWANHREKIDAEFALNEGGGQLQALFGNQFFLCSTGEKGATRLRITARGSAGHASIPQPDTAMAKIGVALQRLTAWRGPIVMSDTTAAMFRAIAATLPEEEASIIDGLLASPNWQLIDALPVDADTHGQLIAVLSNTAVPTIVRGGQQINVIPSEVTVEVDGRISPGQQPEQFRCDVQEAVGNDVEVTITSEETALEAPPSSLLFEAIAETMAEIAPGTSVVPLLLTGGTDARLIPDIGAYGFFPSPNPDRQALYMSLIHAHDERIAIDDLEFGTRFFIRLVEGFCGVDQT